MAEKRMLVTDVDGTLLEEGKPTPVSEDAHIEEESGEVLLISNWVVGNVTGTGRKRSRGTRDIEPGIHFVAPVQPPTISLGRGKGTGLNASARDGKRGAPR